MKNGKNSEIERAAGLKKANRPLYRLGFALPLERADMSGLGALGSLNDLEYNSLSLIESFKALHLEGL